MKYCVKLGKYASETPEMLREVFGERSLSQTGGFEWHSHFKAGRVSVEDRHSGRSSTSKTENIERIREHIHEDCCQTIHELAVTVGISYGVCQEILTENLNVCRIATKFVPQLMTNDRKQQRINMCLEL
jgi:hypothetical protein